MSDTYEPTQEDKDAAASKAKTIAWESILTFGRDPRDRAWQMHADNLAAKIETAILAEVVNRGKPLGERG